MASHLGRLSLLRSVQWQNEYQLSGWVIINGDSGCSVLVAYRWAHGSSRSVWSMGRQPPGAALYPSHEPDELSQWLSHNDRTINIVLGIWVDHLPRPRGVGFRPSASSLAPCWVDSRQSSGSSRPPSASWPDPVSGSRPRDPPARTSSRPSETAGFHWFNTDHRHNIIHCSFTTLTTLGF